MAATFSFAEGFTFWINKLEVRAVFLDVSELWHDGLKQNWISGSLI